MIETEEPTNPSHEAVDAKRLRLLSRLTPTTDWEADAKEIVIRPMTGWLPIDWRELYAYRELLFFFVWRDITARYKQTILGSAWAILQPLLLMGIFTLISSFVSIPTPELRGRPIPYPVFVFAGLIPWTVFSQGMPQAALSLINNQNMMTKLYFPRIFLPITATAVFLVDLVYALGIYAILLLIYQIAPAWTIIFLPLLILQTFIATLSIGVLLAALTLFYRDFRHMVPFLVQITMYVTPVFYSASMFTEKKPQLGWLLSLNPMFGIVDAYRSLILGIPLDLICLLISSTSATVLLIVAVYYFRSTERRFADFA
jgi:lipopolysaccharide transport system permease protein